MLWPSDDPTPPRYRHTWSSLMVLEILQARSHLIFCNIFTLLFQKQAIKDQVQDSDGQSSCPTELVGVLVHPKEISSLSVKESMFQKEPEDQDLDSKMTRSVQRAARRQAKQEELKRLHKAQVMSPEDRVSPGPVLDQRQWSKVLLVLFQMIQRQLQQVEVKQRELEERGVMVEKALRGEAGSYRAHLTHLDPHRVHQNQH